MQSKLHNRTLFVAALSVYLGLLIVGAPPQVLAQAAHNQTSKQELENESESKQPDSENPEIKELLGLNFSEPLAEFIEDLKKLTEIKKFELAYSFDFFVQEIASVYCNVDGDPIVLKTREGSNPDKWLVPALLDFLENSHGTFGTLSDCLPNEHLKNENGVETKVRLSNDESELKLEVIVKKKSNSDARQLSENLNKVFAMKAHPEEENLPKQIYKNTKATSENDQVFIVTRLPRAGLDALLKADERAD